MGFLRNSWGCHVATQYIVVQWIWMQGAAAEPQHDCAAPQREFRRGILPRCL